MQIIEPEKGNKKLTAYLDPYYQVKNVLLYAAHGVGDVVLFLAPLKALREKYPNVHFDLALLKGLDQEKIVPDAVLVNGDETKDFSGERFKKYDIVARINMPIEDIKDLSKTKAEICCERELGIDLTWGHLPIKPKRLVGVHFHNTSVSWVANADEEVAKKIWDEIIDAGCVPVETLFQHIFYNNTSKRYDFTDNHVRNWPARLDTLMALLGACSAFIGIVSGNFHLALSILGDKKVMLLEKDLRVEHFTKLPIARADLRNYQSGCVKQFLEGIK